MAFIAPAIGAASGIIGGITGKNQAKAQNAAANQAAQEQAQINNQLLQDTNTLTNQYNNSYSPLLSPLSSGYQSEAGATDSNIGQITTQLLQAGMDPSQIQQLTGINANQIMQQAEQYMTNPNQTQVGQVGGNVVSQLGNTSGTNLAGATPTASNVFTQQMNQGIDPTFAQNALNQIQQGENQQIAQIKASAQPGTNINGMLMDAQNNALTQEANASANMAGQSQALRAQGATSLLGAASGLDTQKSNMLTQQLNAAGSVDQEKLNMLQQAAQGASGFNQQAFQNLGAVAQQGNNNLSQIQGFLGQGQGAMQSGYNSLAHIGDSYATQQQNAQTAAGNAASGAATSFGNAATSIGNFLTPQSTQASNPFNPAGTSGVGPVASGANYASSVLGGSAPTATNPLQYGPLSTGIGAGSSNGMYGVGPYADGSAYAGNVGLYQQGVSVPPSTLSGSPTTPVVQQPHFTPGLFQSLNYNPNNAA